MLFRVHSLYSKQQQPLFSKELLGAKAKEEKASAGLLSGNDWEVVGSKKSTSMFLIILLLTIPFAPACFTKFKNMFRRI